MFGKQKTTRSSSQNWVHANNTTQRRLGQQRCWSKAFGLKNASINHEDCRSVAFVLPILMQCMLHLSLFHWRAQPGKLMVLFASGQ
jgi:hypothetical protein